MGTLWSSPVQENIANGSQTRLGYHFHPRYCILDIVLVVTKLAVAQAQKTGEIAEAARSQGEPVPTGSWRPQ